MDKKENGEYIATAKYDGYRCIFITEDDIEPCWSRRAKNLGGPSKHPTSDELLEAINKFRIDNKIPNNTMLDAEWMAKRASVGQPDFLAVFGVFYWGDKYLGRKLETKRWELISGLQYNDRIKLVEHTEENYVDFYREHEGNPLLEGVVLKHKYSKLVGHLQKSKKNPLWMKCRWRSGDDGQTIQTW